MKSVFVCYAHEDSDLVERFLKHLKPLEHHGVIPWVDKLDLRPGQDYAKEIRQQLAKCCAAVLMVSPDFVASEYVLRYELPQIREEQKQRSLLVAPLFLRWANDDRLPDDLRLSKTLGLNERGHPVASLRSSSEIDRAFCEAADKLFDELQDAETEPVRDTHTVPCLTIELSRRNGELLRRYRDAREPIGEHLGEDVAAGGSDHEALWRVLFPDQSDAARHAVDRALSRVFRTPVDTVPTPTYGPLRIRVVTAAADLASLPWLRTRWNGKPLWREGWTIEVCRAIDAGQAAEVDLPGPTWLLLEDDEDAGVAGRTAAVDLRDAWVRAFPKSVDHPEVFHRWPSREHIERAGRPAVLVYAGRVRHDEDGNAVLSLAGDGGVPEERRLVELDMYGPSIVIVSCLSVGGGPVMISPASIPANLPLVVTQIASIADGAAKNALRSARNGFWHDVIVGRDPDPVLLAHRPVEGVTTQVFSSCKRLVIHRREPAVDQLVRLLLDRIVQKTRMEREVKALFKAATSRRSCCVVARGAHGNRVDLFCRQLFADLHENGEEHWNLRLKYVGLPPGPEFGVEHVETAVRRHFGLVSGASIAHEVRRWFDADEMASDVCHVMLLAFGVRGGPHGDIPDKKSFEGWLQFCVDHFNQDLGSNVRVISLLQIEAPEAEFDAHVDAVCADSRFRKDHFFYLPLEHLDDVPLIELISFIDPPGSGCPTELQAEFPLLLHRVTAGAFEPTAHWIERAHREGWHAIADELRALADGESEEANE